MISGTSDHPSMISY